MKSWTIKRKDTEGEELFLGAVDQPHTKRMQWGAEADALQFTRKVDAENAASLFKLQYPWVAATNG
jgi:hypothetical protein